ncbi:hypothetical protein LSI54_09095 [Nesterenkonia sp. AY15]|uniref:hypothetical protein n=1 Tax=Nesterenkonia sp. AY15 TaxID=2901139 RepID=UPI001F4C6144|nr:hypothetical protein [Nesterenkonia sp. AY15]MCH8571506.1 hypothetical protein [Nesterenkonia sp. AY15]
MDDDQDRHLAAIGWMLLHLAGDTKRVELLESPDNLGIVAALSEMCIGVLSTSGDRDARKSLLRWQRDQLELLATQEVNHDDH